MSTTEKKDTTTQAKDIYMATSKAKVYKKKKFICSNMSTRSQVDSVSYVKDKSDGGAGDYVVVHHSQHANKAHKLKKKAMEDN